MWLTWIEEIESFSRLPGFLGILLKNEKCNTVLFNILVGKSEFALFGNPNTNAIQALNQLQNNLITL
jgi:hypothetical protein